MFRRLVRNSARVSVIVNEKLRKDEPVRFERLAQEETAAIRDVRNELILQFVIALPRHSGRYTLDPDVYNMQVGGALLRKLGNGANQRTRYLSCFFIVARRTCYMEHRKFYAVAWTVLLPRPIREGT